MTKGRLTLVRSGAIGAFAAAAVVALARVVFSSQPPAFEVVSIKRNTSEQGAGGGVQGELYRANRQNVRGLIMTAYRTDRVLNLPEWADVERYDIVAKAPGAIASQQLPLMVEALLRERFAFRGHRETRNVPTYKLVLARDATTLGPRLRRSTVDCAAASATCGGGSRSGTLSFVGMQMATLAQALGAPAGRPVFNDTGLTGRFDIDLDWSATLGDTDHVSLFTAVQEQLGLKLTASTADLEFVVVDNVARPTEN